MKKIGDMRIIRERFGTLWKKVIEFFGISEILWQKMVTFKYNISVSLLRQEMGGDVGIRGKVFGTTLIKIVKKVQ